MQTPMVSLFVENDQPQSGKIEVYLPLLHGSVEYSVLIGWVWHPLICYFYIRNNRRYGPSHRQEQ